MGSVYDSDSELDFIFHAPVVCKSPTDKDGCEGGSASLTSHLGAAATHRSVMKSRASLHTYISLFILSLSILKQISALISTNALVHKLIIGHQLRTFKMTAKVVISLTIVYVNV